MRNRLLLVLCCIVILLSCTGCNLRFKQDMPDAAVAQDCFDRNRERIALVTDYLCALNRPDAWVNAPNGIYFSDFEWHPIENSAVCEAIAAWRFPWTGFMHRPSSL